jgi:hypothetical protein
MAHFLCGERRVVRRPHPRNMGGARADAKTTANEISVMFQKADVFRPARAGQEDGRKKATQKRN